MSKFKRIFSILMVMLICFGVASCSTPNNTEVKNEKKEAVISVSLTGPYFEGYYFQLLDDGTYLVGQGNITFLNFRNREFETTDFTQYKEVSLSEDQYKNIVDMIDNLGEFNGEEIYALDLPTVNMVYNEEDVRYTYGCSKNEKYDQLVTKLIDLSPIDTGFSLGKN